MKTIFILIAMYAFSTTGVASHLENCVFRAYIIDSSSKSTKLHLYKTAWTRKGSYIDCDTRTNSIVKVKLKNPRKISDFYLTNDQLIAVQYDYSDGGFSFKGSQPTASWTVVDAIKDNKNYKSLYRCKNKKGNKQVECFKNTIIE